MTVSSGIAMEIHYCMGERAGADFYGSSSDKCGKCGMTEQNKKGCCHDDNKFFKLADSHKKAANDFSFFQHEILPVPSYALYNWNIPVAGANTITNNNSPPGYQPPPARILHGVFRI